MRGGERRLWSWGTAVVRQLGQEEEEEALAVRHLWGNLGILLQGRNAALLVSLLLPCHSRWGQTCKEVRNSLFGVEKRRTKSNRSGLCSLAFLIFHPTTKR